MKIIFESDGSPEDFARILQVLMKLSDAPSSSTTTILPRKLDAHEMLQEAPIPKDSPITNVEPISHKELRQPKSSSNKKKAQRKRQMARDTDPFELIKQGWYYKGTYIYDRGKSTEHKRVTLSDSKNTKHNLSWRIGNGPRIKGIDEETAKRIIAEGSKNRIHLKPRGGQRTSSKVALTTTSAALVASSSDPKASSPEKSQVCQICLQRGKELRRCDIMRAPHCKGCHESSHGDMLHPSKPI